MHEREEELPPDVWRHRDFVFFKGALWMVLCCTVGDLRLFFEKGFLHFLRGSWIDD